MPLGAGPTAVPTNLGYYFLPKRGESRVFRRQPARPRPLAPSRGFPGLAPPVSPCANTISSPPGSNPGAGIRGLGVGSFSQSRRLYVKYRKYKRHLTPATAVGVPPSISTWGFLLLRCFLRPRLCRPSTEGSGELFAQPVCAPVT